MSKTKKKIMIWLEMKHAVNNPKTHCGLKYVK